MQLYRIIIVLILLCSIQVAVAQELSSIPASFLNLGFGARGLGMGGAYNAAADDVHSLVWNPAGLSALKRLQLSFSYGRQFGLVPYYFLASGNSFGQSWAHGEAFIVSGDDLMLETRVIGGLARYFDRYVPGLRLGLTFEGRHASFGRTKTNEVSNISGEAYGMSISIGSQYEVSSHLTLALVLRDFINTMQWNSTGEGSYSEGFPKTFIGGIALKQVLKFTVDLDVEKSLGSDAPDKIYAGFERPMFRYFILRSGFSRNFGLAESTSQAAIGTGLRNVLGDHLFIDFTYLFHDIQDSFRMSVIFQK